MIAMYHYHRREPLLPLRHEYNYYHYERGENAYFRYELDPFRKIQPRRYNPETTPVNE